MKNIIFILAILFTISLHANDFITKNSITMGLGGAGMTYSVQYERMVYKSEKQKLLFQAGFGYFPMYVNNKPTLGTLNNLLGITCLQSFNKQHIEFGFMNNIAVTMGPKYRKTNFIIVPLVGYRYHNFAQPGLFLKAGYSPLISFKGIATNYKSFFFKNYFYLGVGYGF